MDQGICLVPDSDRSEVRTLVEQLGLNGAARELGLTPETTARVIAGVGVRRGTVLVVRQGLERRGGGR